MGGDDREAAYFALLRAREELTALQRYGEWLVEEQQRTRRWRAEGEAHATRVGPRLRRPLRAVDRGVHEAMDARLRVLAEEEAGIADRLEEAAAYVAACEADLAAH